MNANSPVKSEEVGPSSGKFGLQATKHLDTEWKGLDVCSIAFSVWLSGEV
jgi:hypothetical protein